MNEKNILLGYEYAKEAYAAMGIDVDAAMEKADAIPVSMHCWQGDDVIGFDGSDSLTGGIQTTGNYPGRARNIEELRKDIDFARTMSPGVTKLNLHASSAEKNGKKIDRDAYTIEEFQGWVDWAKAQNVGLDFNPTYFGHPMMDGDLSLSSPKENVRKFWIEPYGLYELGMAGVMIALGVDFPTATIITVMTRVITLVFTIASGSVPYYKAIRGKND